MDPQVGTSNSGNGWTEYKREVLLRLDTLEDQLDEIEVTVTKIDRDMIKLLAQRGQSRFFHSLVLPAVVAGLITLALRFL